MTASTRLQALIDSLAPTRVPGLTLAVGNRDGLVWEGAAGYADIESQTPADPACVLGVGSITKVLVAALVLQLVEEKRLALDHTLNSYLSTTALAGIANADVTTVGQLLSHYSGIASWEEDARWIRDARGERITPGKQWASVEPLNYIRGASPDHDVGARFHYSNTHYTLLGLLIEAVTAKPFEQAQQGVMGI
jgi:D-alanyl-D-alanine carboxypeptidase